MMDRKKSKTGYVQVKDAALFYQIRGKGFPVVLLHGNRQNQHIFSRQIRFFEKNYQVISIDSRGHGRSGLGKTVLDFTRLAQDVIAVLGELKIKQTIIFGFSDGANTALKLAMDYPQRVVAIVAVSANLQPKELKNWVQGLINLEYRFWMLLGALHFKVRRQKQLSALMAAQPKFLEQQLKNINVPTLIAAGTHDIMPVNHTRYIAQVIPGAQLSLVKCKGHLSVLRKMQMDEVEAFLGQVKK
ncbi:MAG: alpha/beta hydrolase [Eubacterium sp.]